MLPEEFATFNYILGSKSPRRQHLLKELGLKFNVAEIDVDESYPPELEGEDIAIYLCELKADSFDLSVYPENTILITADTIVWLDGECIGKPRGRADAIKILSKLSGKSHYVYSGICLRHQSLRHVFSSATKVHFKELSQQEIEYYITHHRPYDKAGAYGIQEWIGYIGIEGIEGCYYNVMGFPIQKFYGELQNFVISINGKLL